MGTRAHRCFAIRRDRILFDLANASVALTVKVKSIEHLTGALKS